MMVTPRVVEEVRRHFNCSTLEGAELEDQGGEGTTTTLAAIKNVFTVFIFHVAFVCFLPFRYGFDSLGEEGV